MAMIQGPPRCGMCSTTRNRYIMILLIVTSSWLLAILYFKPLTRVSIVQVDASFLSKELNVNAELRNSHTDASSDKNSSSENSVETLLSNISGPDSEILTESPTTSEVDPTFNSTHVASQNVRCERKRNVSFLKVHKAGSTTLMNIFLRFAIQNNLNIVLPPRTEGFGFNYLGYGKTVYRKNIIPLPGDEVYNILCNHVVYNRSAFRSIMPADTEYVAIIREPTSQFLSASAYYGLFNRMKRYVENRNFSSPIGIVGSFLENPSKFPFDTGYEHNRMSFDFGVPTSKFYNTGFLKRYFAELEDDFSLIMVLERFPESLVMMKRALCWHTKDIMYVPLNEGKSKSVVNLTDTDVANLRVWNGADFRLYDRFSKVFDKIVAAEGNDFAGEVEQFKATQSQVEAFCRASVKPQNTTAYASGMIQFADTRWSPGFEVTSEDCLLMTESELPMMKRLITAAWDRYTVWNSTRTEPTSNT